MRLFILTKGSGQRENAGPWIMGTKVGRGATRTMVGVAPWNSSIPN